MNWRKMHRNRRKRQQNSTLARLDKAMKPIFTEMIRWGFSKDRPLLRWLEGEKNLTTGL